MARRRFSIIVTVFNEQSTISKFIESVFSQSKFPDELIIVDGGSQDGTLQQIEKYKKFKHKKIRISVIIKKGNRSIGRNEAIRNANGEIILCSDAGCTLDRDWVKNISKPFNDKSVDAVAGYYEGNSKTIFQKCLIPYALVMKDRLKESEFLPATRSMAFKKNIWKKVGGFDEKLSHNEDYFFATKLMSSGAKIVFAKNAIVYWTPRKNIKEAFIMFFRFAYGDGESGLLRNKVLLVFLRYIFFLYLITICYLIKSPIILALIIISPISYVSWAIKKNYKYIKNRKAFVILPILQIISDIAIIIGTCLGSIKYLTKINYKKLVQRNIVLIVIICIYVITMMSVISSGIPNNSHPFTYQMDEWHQAQAIRSVFKYGSPNVEGAANGTMFNFFISGLLLIPPFIFGLVNPFSIKSSIESLNEQGKLFIVLRLITLFFGILTLILLPKISKILKVNRIFTVFIFVFTPIWLVLSNFFKYDIALTFWMVLSIYFLIKYGFSTKLNDFFFGAFFSGIAFAVKVSALPLLPIIIFAYLLFTPQENKKIQNFLIGVFLFILNSIFLGLPDIVFGGRSMSAYLYENIVHSSEILSDYSLGQSLLNLTLLHKLPFIFGHAFYFTSIFSILYVFFLTFKDFKNKLYHEFKLKLFILLSFFIFCISFIPLGVTISANRSIVLLPFLVIIDSIAFKNLTEHINKKILLKLPFYSLVAIFLGIQLFESYLWILTKLFPSPQEESSSFVVRNISENSNIGLENIPIYQFEPDFVLKEFYEKQYNSKIKTRYNYFIVDRNTNKLPQYIILSNVDFERKFLKKSPKNDLVNKIIKENYKRIGYFELKLPMYNFLDNYFYYPYLGLFAYPDAISIYKK